MQKRSYKKFPFHLLLMAGLAGCPTPENATADSGMLLDGSNAPTTYEFTSRFNEGESSVSYAGQVTRHALIKSLKNYIGSLDDNSYVAGVTVEQVKEDLRFFSDYKNQGGSGAEELPYSLKDASNSSIATLQTLYSDLGGAASLEEKLANVDAEFGEARWSQGYKVIGYKENDLTPSAVLDDMLTQLATIIANRADGIYEKDPSGADLESPYISSLGVNYQQLIQKFLDGAITYSQATDDYMDDDLDEKGLYSNNIEQVEKNGELKPYTALERSWDEAFGYFGAARNYNDYTDDEIAAKGGRPEYATGFYDANGDQKIDVTRELNQGHSINAAKRDRSTEGASATDFSNDAFTAFVAGRHFIATHQALNDDELDELRAFRDSAHLAWEKAIAATVIHYTNLLLKDLSLMNTADFDFSAYAKHFSEGKGFALSLQFSPRASLSRVQLQQLHDAIGIHPISPSAEQTELENYKTRLREVKSILQEALNFHDDNMGNANGENGW